MLQGVVRGVYRVHAAASTTSINSGAFTIQDRCDGTLTKITKGRARVKITKGPRRNRQVTLTQGQTLLVQVQQFAAKQITTRHHTGLTPGAASSSLTGLASLFATLALPSLQSARD
jgi:ferric-dicitrate binding protein FerR (iron transport regulator)